MDCGTQHLNQQYQQQLQQQYLQGLNQFNQSQGLLGNIGQMQSGVGQQQLGIQENVAQAEIARRQMDMEIAENKKNRTSQFWGGLLGSAAGGFTNWILDKYKDIEIEINLFYKMNNIIFRKSIQILIIY